MYEAGLLEKYYIVMGKYYIFTQNHTQEVIERLEIDDL